MIEKHPFGVFVPLETEYFLLGSFTGKIMDDSYDWFYANKRNQFWPIMEKVYKTDLNTKAKKQKLFTKLGMAIADIILTCERRAGNNLDTNLINIKFNTRAVTKVIKKNKIKKIFFSSRFVEKLFRKVFKDIVQQYPKIELVTLPSPSPRYAMMTKQEKIEKYKELLPRLGQTS